MLVLRRKVNERIVLTGGIRILLVEGRQGGAAIGIDAPPGIEVVREELLDEADLARMMGPPEAPAL